ncbi:MAG: hypothetical protein Kow0077_08470 [Anaerolineae bacterium]
MQGFVNFMASTAGRVLRAAVGIVLLAVALFASTGTTQIVLAILGVFFLAVGVFDVCVFAPLAGLPFSGKAIREK